MRTLLMAAAALLSVSCTQADATVPPAQQINTERLGAADCGLTVISGRSCIYCINGNMVQALSCDWGHQ